MPVFILIKERKGSWGSGGDLGEVLGEETILGYLLYLKNLFSKKEKKPVSKVSMQFYHATYSKSACLFSTEL